MRTIRKTKCLQGIIFLLLCLSPLHAVAQYSDTIYYNRNWQITEKPFAHYYRIGYVGFGNPYIIYTGKTTDHFADGTLEMEGHYSVDGLKTGPFKFYNPKGKLILEGNYKQGLFDGDWTYYRSSGDKMAVIHYEQPDQVFTVKELYDSTGKALMKNGSGDFLLPFYDINRQRSFLVKGEMSKGRRSGMWTYYTEYNGRVVQLYQEKYSDGKVKKTTSYSLTGFLMRTEDLDLKIIRAGDFPQFRAIDSFFADPSIFSYLDRDSIPQKDAVKNFLFDKTPVLIDATGDSVHQSFNIILTKLNSMWLLRNFNDQYKEYRVSISFHISDTGTLHDFNFKGNFSPREIAMASNVLEKFRNVKPIMIENVEVDALHTIHFYSIHAAEILPKYMQEGADTRMLIFTMAPREKLVAKIKKDIKLALKTNQQLASFINNNLRWQLRD